MMSADPLKRICTRYSSTSPSRRETYQFAATSGAPCWKPWLPFPLKGFRIKSFSNCSQFTFGFWFNSILYKFWFCQIKKLKQKLLQLNTTKIKKEKEYLEVILLIWIRKLVLNFINILIKCCCLFRVRFSKLFSKGHL